ncbi:MAG TPA: hypothetical protein DCE41_11560 [Cytophagales bacterium]|nr:hypothetical protein [Cytophagales bacterium]HAA22329.1 hypothetical protein [Cytophagales bacterium]HAP60460.1 hypothetical protein [Cytophagales bacterium]
MGLNWLGSLVYQTDSFTEGRKPKLEVQSRKVGLIGHINVSALPLTGPQKLERKLKGPFAFRLIKFP